MQRFFMGLVLAAASASNAQTLTSFTALDTNVSTWIGYPASTVIGTERHYFDVQNNASARTSQLRWCHTPGTATSCTWAPIDGASATTIGAMSDLHVFIEVTAITWNGSIHLFYAHQGAKNVLRHGVFSGSGWFFETIDGNGGTHGETTHSVATTVAASGFVAGSVNWLFIAYQDLQTARLRIGWFSPGATSWSFQDHDGAGGVNGRINANVGLESAFAASSSQLRLFYSDHTNGDLREAIW